nr:exodeoxyribonuclease III [Deinococcus peraridilitoris]
MNVNGLRSALRKGLLDWLEREQSDVVLLQEVRADPHPEVFAPLGYFSSWSPAQKAGYSGVAVLSRRAPDAVEVGVLHDAYDAEGRVLLTRFGPLQVVSVYVPSGSSGEARQQFKEEFLKHFHAWTRERLARGPMLLGGDLNIAHQNIDLKNWRSNQKNSGFLPQERRWLTEYLALGLRDTHRDSLGERAEYTWWSNRGNAYSNDVGWRLDYLLSGGLTLGNVRADREARLSDHAPLTGELLGAPDLSLLLRPGPPDTPGVP